MVAAVSIPAALGPAYRAAARITRQHSSSYSLAMRTLPAASRPHVHALYAFARTADDIVDEPGPDPVGALARYRRVFDEAMAAGPRGVEITDPVIAAVANTIRCFEMSLVAFDRFFDSMAMDLTVGRYETWADLSTYMEGSAAAIGEMMLPILAPTDPAGALEPARDLGRAFQLTNFLRDIADDLDRGREYLPQEDLHRFGVTLRARRVDDRFRSLMRFEIERCRELYRSAEAGIALLPESSARGIRAAAVLYERLLDRIEAIDFDVFSRRARLSAPKKVRGVLGALVRH